MRPNKCIVLFIVLSVLWVSFLVYFIVRNLNVTLEQKELLEKNLNNFEVRVEKQFSNSILRNELQTAITSDELQISKPSMENTGIPTATTEARGMGISNADSIPILVLACNRVTVSRCLDGLIKFRPSKERFPIIVSQDCGDEATSNVIQSYGKEILFFTRQPDQSVIALPFAEQRFTGYYKVARHYKWALDKMFNYFNFETVIVVEDDLDVAPDFYDYFAATLPVLKADQSLWCVSAWNDNGKPDLIDGSKPELLYRTDFFPGLGWMLTKSLWDELAYKWPKSYWDDWMRRPEQRKSRSCIRPELSRTRTFGKIGVSGGTYYEEHLKHIFLNEKPVDFANQDLSYLLKEVYDPGFLELVYGSPIVSVQELQTDRVFAKGPVRVSYSGQESLAKVLQVFGLMNDIRSGIPRTAYLDVITMFYRGRRVFIAPA